MIPRQAYIFNSLKHPDEIRTLREIYGDSFFLISVYAPESDRLENLAKRIAKSRNDRNTQKFVEVAKILVDKNSKEVGDNFGQDVRDTFPSGDIFINEKIT